MYNNKFINITLKQLIYYVFIIVCAMNILALLLWFNRKTPIFQADSVFQLFLFKISYHCLIGKKFDSQEII